jgi:hypothetical protein
MYVLYERLYVCMYVCKSVCMYHFKHILMYVCKYVCMYVERDSLTAGGPRGANCRGGECESQKPAYIHTYLNIFLYDVR